MGVAGYGFRKLGCEPAPLILGLVLGPMIEENFRRAMALAGGDFTVFFTRPISLALILIAAAMIALIALPAFRNTREEALQDD